MPPTSCEPTTLQSSRHFPLEVSSFPKQSILKFVHHQSVSSRRLPLSFTKSASMPWINTITILKKWISSGRRFDALILFVDSIVPLSLLEMLSAQGTEGKCHPLIEDFSVSIRITREVTAYKGTGYEASASNSSAQSILQKQNDLLHTSGLGYCKRGGRTSVYIVMSSARSSSSLGVLSLPTALAARNGNADPSSRLRPCGLTYRDSLGVKGDLHYRRNQVGS